MAKRPAPAAEIAALQQALEELRQRLDRLEDFVGLRAGQGMAERWKQVAGKVKPEWGRLTDDELDHIAGQRDKVVGRVERPRVAEDEAAPQAGIEPSEPWNLGGPGQGSREP